jgi:hypothetical protein
MTPSPAEVKRMERMVDAIAAAVKSVVEAHGPIIDGKPKLDVHEAMRACIAYAFIVMSREPREAHAELASAFEYHFARGCVDCLGLRPVPPEVIELAVDLSEVLEQIFAPPRGRPH